MDRRDFFKLVSLGSFISNIENTKTSHSQDLIMEAPVPHPIPRDLLPREIMNQIHPDQLQFVKTIYESPWGQEYWCRIRPFECRTEIYEGRGVPGQTSKRTFPCVNNLELIIDYYRIIDHEYKEPLEVMQRLNDEVAISSPNVQTFARYNRPGKLYDNKGKLIDNVRPPILDVYSLGKGLYVTVHAVRDNST